MAADLALACGKEWSVWQQALSQPTPKLAYFRQLDDSQYLLSLYILEKRRAPKGQCLLPKGSKTAPRNSQIYWRFNCSFSLKTPVEIFL